MNQYLEFLRTKIQVAPETGFEVNPEDVNPALKPHQRDAVIWACRGGRRALFESFGLGKTVQELEWCRLTAAHEGGQALIVLPLGVRQEFSRDAAELLGMNPPSYVRTMAEAAEHRDAPILMTNYERVRDGDMDPATFCAAALDEASVLRSFGSKTYQTFLDKFRGVKYKLVCTATPSPNKYKELMRRSEGEGVQRPEPPCHEADPGGEVVYDSLCIRRPWDERRKQFEELENRRWWPAEPDVGRVAHGVPYRVDRLKCLGNAVVPQQFYPVFKAIADVELSK